MDNCRYLTCCRKGTPGDHIRPCKSASQSPNTRTHTHTVSLISDCKTHTACWNKMQPYWLEMVPAVCCHCFTLQTLSHNGPSCMNQHQLKPQLQLQHPPQAQHPQQQQPLHHPQALGPMMAPSCSLAAQQALSCSSSSSSQSGSNITSTLTHSGWV